MPRSNPLSILSEIKRRNVFRVTAAYLVVGWLTLQVSDILLDFAGAPEWVGKAIIAVLLLGLILTVVLAWVFEITPEGIKRDDGTVNAGDSARAQRLDKLTIVAALIVAAMFLWQQTRSPTDVAAVAQNPAAEGDSVGRTESAPGEIAAASIAVLPFADLSPNGDQEYFSDGIAEEILNALTRVNGLKVASRTSSFGFKGQEALGMPLIAEKLQVRHVLEGSVRKSGNAIRITAQIIDASVDRHLWSETYDRELSADNIFTVQDEIANAIVAQLAHVIGLEDGAPMISVIADTQNLSAYETYLEARALFARRNSANLPVAMAKLEQAVATDPNFARAWSHLAASYSVAPSWGIRDRDYVALSNRAAERAIELNPELSLPYAVLGSNFTEHPPGQFAEAFAYHEQALKRDPNNATAFLWRAEDYTAAGFFKEALADLNRCLEIDPSYMLCKSWTAKNQFYLENTEQAFALFAELVSAGSRALSWEIVLAYANAGENDLARWALARFFSDFSLMHGRSELLYRALTDPDFDFEAEAAIFEIEYRAIHGNYDVRHYPFAFILKQYDELAVSLTHTLWWNRTSPDFLQSPHRKRLIREAGLPEFWRENGYPPQCRAVGADDFECD
jgi:TolB-like protein/cytochrome c-type biogenesis protein CcmH/NrfG